MHTLRKQVQLSLMRLGTVRGTALAHSWSVVARNLFLFIYGRATEINESPFFLLYLHHT